MPRPEAPTSLSWTCAVPVLCALHCAAAPLFAGLLPALALSAAMEWLLLGATLGLAVTAAGLRVHRLWPVPLTLGLGFTVWGLSLAGVFAPLPEIATTLAGSLVVAGGLFWNARESRQERGRACGRRGCDDTEDSSDPYRGERPVRLGQSAAAHYL